MAKSVIFIGGGGHALAIHDLIAHDSKYRIEGYTDLAKTNLPFPYLGSDDDFLKKLKWKPSDVMVVMAIGANPVLRGKLFEKYKEKGYQFLSCAHSSAAISSSAVCEEGYIFLAGVVVGPKSQIKQNVLLHNHVIVEHETVLGAHAYISPAAVIAGKCVIGDRAFFGIHACCIEELILGDNIKVGAGAVIINSFKDSGLTLVGVPAKAVEKHAKSR